MPSHICGQYASRPLRYRHLRQCTYTCTCADIKTYIYIYAHTSTLRFMHIHIHTHMHIHTRMYTHTNMHTWTYLSERHPDRGMNQYLMRTTPDNLHWEFAEVSSTRSVNQASGDLDGEVRHSPMSPVNFNICK